MGDDDQIAAAVERLDLGPLRERLSGRRAWLVGGVARALAGGEDPGGDIDIAVEEEVEPLVAGIEDAPARTHERFGTATVPLPGGAHADLARTRSETYEHPGALPRVEPAPIADDLLRRDFTVNAIAIALDAPHEVLDPFDGRADLGSRTLRVLHPGSFADDPTRAIRAARYSSRLDLAPDPETLGLLATADLSTVSAERRDAELARLAAEERPEAGFALLAEWGLADLGPQRLRLIGEVAEAAAPGSAESVEAVMLVVGGGSDLDRALELAATEPERGSEGVRLAAGLDGAALLVAAAAGAGWVRDRLPSWREVALEIDGNDLIAAGIEPGPAIGAALDGVLARRLDGEVGHGREAELEVALAIARGSI